MSRRSNQPKDPRGGHVRLYWDILDSHAWRALANADIRIYVAMRRNLGMTNNGNINATLTELKHAGVKSSSTLANALHRLEALGFIAKTRQGGIAGGGKLCSLYRFTDEATYDIPKVGVVAGRATNDWKRFKAVREAKAAVAHLARKNNSKVRNSNRSASKFEAQATECASNFEHMTKTVLRKSKRNIQDEIAPETA